MTHNTDSLNESVSLISIPSCHTESVSGEVQKTTESISIHQKIIRIMAYTKTKSSVRNYVDVQYTATYQQKLSLLPSVVESMEKMEVKFD
jgi:DNA polymerase elongation subunit (family B)